MGFSRSERDREVETSSGPLRGVKVLDFSTLLPGPLATLILARAGASVLKVERPNGGDEMRSYVPRFGSTSANFAILNEGKRSVVADLKDPDDVTRVAELMKRADVLVEQFRPRTLERLGLGYEQAIKLNPSLIYCSITGYGQNGPKAARAGHDLNYIAETGLLSLTTDVQGAPTLPPLLIADLVGGTYPAVLNIILALRQRDAGGAGVHIDISMSNNLFSLQYWALANAGAEGTWPRPGGELVTGGSARYQLYRTGDGAFLAVAALEDRFWNEFCQLVNLPDEFHDDRKDPVATRRAVAKLLQEHDAAYWEARFDGKDVCVSRVQSLVNATVDPHFAAYLSQRHSLNSCDAIMPALPLPLADEWRNSFVENVPELGADNVLLDEPSRW